MTTLNEAPETVATTSNPSEQGRTRDERGTFRTKAAAYVLALTGIAAVTGLAAKANTGPSGPDQDPAHSSTSGPQTPGQSPNAAPEADSGQVPAPQKVVKGETFKPDPTATKTAEAKPTPVEAQHTASPDPTTSPTEVAVDDSNMRPTDGATQNQGGEEVVVDDSNMRPTDLPEAP